MKGNARGKTGISHLKKKSKEDRGHTKLPEVVISSACLLVRDADRRAELTERRCSAAEHAFAALADMITNCNYRQRYANIAEL